jgi:hypothetical protein
MSLVKIETTDHEGSPAFTGAQDDKLRKAIRIEELAIYCDQTVKAEESHAKGAHEILQRVR